MTSAEALAELRRLMREALDVGDVSEARSIMDAALHVRAYGLDPLSGLRLRRFRRRAAVRAAHRP